MPLLVPNESLLPYKIVAIDPGSNFLGLSVFQIGTRNEIQSIVARTIVVEHLEESPFENTDIQSNRLVKQLKIEAELYRTFMYWKPQLVVCETPFYNRLRPGAFAPLVEVISSIQRTVISYNNLVPFIGVEPSVIKKSVDAGYICGKDEMKVAVSLIPEIINNLETSYDSLDEHAIDSLAIGYSYVKHQCRLLGKEY